jgi:hypothetical protein
MTQSQLQTAANKSANTVLGSPNMDYEQGFAIGANFYASSIKNNLEDIKESLESCISQIEYLHEKFKPTGSGNAVLSRAKTQLETLNKLLER